MPIPSQPLDPAQFRLLFPALRSMVWLDTPACPPGARPVVDALRNTLSAWSSGDFDLPTWESAAAEARTLFARLVGVDPATVSTLGSLAEAAATVAASLPPGRIVLPAQEFRSNLFPWSARHDVVTAPARGGGGGVTRVDDLRARR